MALLEPGRADRPRAPEPAADRAPTGSRRGRPQPLRRELESLLGPDRVLARPIDLVRYASDASPYRLFPKAVVMARDVEDVSKLLGYARRGGTPVTLRSGGTEPQRPGTGRRHPGRRPAPLHRRRGRGRRGARAGRPRHDAGARQPGPGGVRAKARPRPGEHGLRHRRRGDRQQLRGDALRRRATIPTRPSARSPCCSPSGTLIDTEAPDAEAAFAESEPELARGLEEIRDEILADSELADRIRRKFRIKNTTGYRLCAFLDAETPLEIFRRLVVGSEGTLAFVAEAVFETVPAAPEARSRPGSTSSDIAAAAEPVPDLVAAGASAVELMVAPALIAAGPLDPGDARPTGRSCPLNRRRCWSSSGPTTTAELDAMEAAARSALGRSRAPSRAGVHPRRRGDRGLLAGPRGDARDRRAAPPPGTALIIEDVCVPPERIAESATDIQALLGKHGFLTGVAGHASAGNLHFMLTPEFSRGGGAGPLRGVHGRARRPDRRQVRRLAEGGARHRDQHGALRRAGVGAQGDRADVAGEAARRPGRACWPRGWS